MNAIPNRRGLLLGALTAGAAAPLAAIPAIAAAEPADPAFSLVEAHKAAWARLLEIEGAAPTTTRRLRRQDEPLTPRSRRS
jgi:hypothetical protein